MESQNWNKLKPCFDYFMKTRTQLNLTIPKPKENQTQAVKVLSHL